MRDLKFRAWDKENKEWVYSKPMPDMGFWKWVSYDSTTPFYEWAGLKDKNGKETYEGDILKWKTYNDRLEVKWGRVGWVLSSKLFTNRFGHCGEVNTEGYTVNSEVIGNIYENPDLLSDKEGDK